MKQIRLLSITFENNLKPFEIRAFRAAIVEKVGNENDLFHNHRPDKSCIYRYPLIQYKSFNHKAGILCIENGIEELPKLFMQKDWTLKFLDREETLQIYNTFPKQYKLQVWDHTFQYRLFDWLALNQENYQKYQALKSYANKLKMLEELLASHILAFAMGINWQIEARFDLAITAPPFEKVMRFKGVPLMAFDVRFETNLSLPHYVGLGKAASFGFGVLKGESTRNKVKISSAKREQQEQPNEL